MKYEAKTESAFERIRLAILAGELAPGMPLRMSQLSKHYEISATPLREALSRLEEKRLVVAEPNKGWRVAPVSFEELEDLEFARLTIEESLMRDAIAHGDVDWEATIVASHHRLQNGEPPIDKHDIQTRLNWIEVHDGFHNALLSAGSSSWLKRFYAETNEQLQRHHQALLFHPDVINPDGPGLHSEQTISLLREALAISQHTILMQAVLDRDADKSIELLRQHVEITMTVYQSISEDVLSRFGT